MNIRLRDDMVFLHASFIFPRFSVGVSHGSGVYERRIWEIVLRAMEVFSKARVNS